MINSMVFIYLCVIGTAVLMKKQEAELKMLRCFWEDGQNEEGHISRTALVGCFGNKVSQVRLKGGVVNRQRGRPKRRFMEVVKEDVQGQVEADDLLWQPKKGSCCTISVFSFKKNILSVTAAVSFCYILQQYFPS